MLTHTHAHDVAHYLIQLANREAVSTAVEEPGFLTALQLQKLLYFVQGWSLAERGVPLFAEPIKAWREGPVVREVWDEFKRFGRRPIELEEPPQSILSDTERELVAQVWEAYKRYSAWGLRDMTHDDPAWKDSYRPDASGLCDRTMSLDAIRQSFTLKIEAASKRFASKRAGIVERASEQTQRLLGRRAV